MLEVGSPEPGPTLSGTRGVTCIAATPWRVGVSVQSASLIVGPPYLCVCVPLPVSTFPPEGQQPWG